MLNTRTVGGHRPRSNAPTPVISVGGTEGRQPGSLFSVQLISRGGTQSSNPVRSSGESVSRPKPLSYAENPGFPRGCARLAWRLGRQRRAGCFDTAATGGNISVGPYSSTAVPLTGSWECPDGANEVGAFSGLDRALDL